jgi:hypothetical protein
MKLIARWVQVAAIEGKRHTIHLFLGEHFCWTVGMTENREVLGQKRRSSEEIKRLAAICPVRQKTP